MLRIHQEARLVVFVVLAVFLTALLAACGDTATPTSTTAATTTVATTTATTTAAATTTTTQATTSTTQAATTAPVASTAATTTDLATTAATTRRPTATATTVPTVVPDGTIVPGNLQIGFAQTFTPSDCPSDATDTKLCISVKATGETSALGKITVTRTVIVQNASAGDCNAATTTGTLTTANGDSVNMSAKGQVCLNNGSAYYNYTFSGGTGKFKNASGSGVITVPPPTDSSHGTETWSGSLNPGQ